MEKHDLWNSTKPSERMIVFLNPLPSVLQYPTVIFSKQHWQDWLADRLQPSGNSSQPLFTSL